MGKSKGLVCTFCSKGKPAVKHLISGPGVCICEECIELSSEIVDEREQEERAQQELEAQQANKVLEFRGVWKGEMNRLDTHLNNLNQYFDSNIKNVRKRRVRRGA